MILAEGGWGDEVERAIAARLTDEVSANIHVSHAATAKGHTVTIPVEKSWLGEPSSTWGYQLLILGQEGGEGSMDGIKIRRVLEEETEWQFGGSDESGYHTNIIDMLTPTGDDQRQLLSAHDAASETYVVIPMIFPHN